MNGPLSSSQKKPCPTSFCKNWIGLCLLCPCTGKTLYTLELKSIIVLFSISNQETFFKTWQKLVFWLKLLTLHLYFWLEGTLMWGTLLQKSQFILASHPWHPSYSKARESNSKEKEVWRNGQFGKKIIKLFPAQTYDFVNILHRNIYLKFLMIQLKK